ncbi:uncharacterized protein LOC129905167 isoform X2 [Episyrphus balteatus]|uniref:uncharacterized protein LOC129905167 isoform X2 n=1 Tax=Episyrphus balteatus TaxID=286459 RepID=UPI002486456E|nr:uncharacterized protein LOC129905167 isoform X2 [Episyrphus balteatus]
MLTNKRIWTNIAVCIGCLLVFCECVNYLPSVSQISPKSTKLEASDGSSKLTARLESTLIDPSSENLDRTHPHSRIERSALPILNDIKKNPNDLDDVDDEEVIDVQKVEAGRYFQYNIKPTETLSELSENAKITKSSREAKGLTVDDSFLSKGDLRSVSSGSPNAPIAPSTATPISATAPVPNQARQNPNPDIQDIITGIVKLLNGNVNVHANNQVGHRRPTASRINNRGPPRISDVQTLPMDYDIQKPLPDSSIRPPPYPFDRPERPFITGVPIPEQIVPYRPGFISNRPPWHRNRPRPPINTGNGGRRPIPQYMPPPDLNEHPEPSDHLEVPNLSQPNNSDHSEQEEEVQLTTLENENENNETVEVAPTDTTYDNDLPKDDEFPNHKDEDSSSKLELELPSIITEEVPIKKDEDKKKKPTSKIKSSEKKVIPASTEDFSKIIESTSVVSSMSTPILSSSSSNYEPMSNEDFINASSEDIIFMTTSAPKKTPSLEISTSSSSTTPSISIKPPETTTSTEVLIETISSSSTEEAHSTSATSSSSAVPYHPRPGIVLDDPEFKPGGHARPPLGRPPRPQQPNIQPTRQQLPPGYGEIFDVTLSAIQGPGSGTGSQQTINIKPYGYGGQQGGSNNNGDIIVSPSGDDGFVSIDGKRTYINLFGDPTDPPGVAATTTAGSTTPTTSQIPNNSSPQPKPSYPSPPPGSGTGYAVPETEVVDVTPSKPSTKPTTHTNQTPSQRPHYRPRTTQPPVRIDTCIVGDDSTCDQAQHERCKTENGVSSCHCRPGYSRRKHREPCRKVVSFFVGLRVDRFYEHRIVWDNKLLDRTSEPYSQLSYESTRAMDSAMSMTPYSDEFIEAKVNNIYRGDPSQGSPGVFVNLTLKIEENAETLRPNLRSDVQKHLLGVIHRRNNNIGNSVLYVESPQGAISSIQDLDECESNELNDCHQHASCKNIWGSFRCACEAGFRDPWADQFQRAGRECQSCPDAYCNNRGTCSYNEEGAQSCDCDGSHYGGQCEIDGEVLGVAIGASVAALIIIVLTLVCLIMWSRRWQREQKNAIGSPVFGYMNTTPLKSAGMLQPGYQVTLEDRMRWAQIADVMAQANHYGAEPIAQTRPSSAMFGYPNLHAMGLNTMGGMSHMGSTMQMHQNGTLPPVPLPRLGLGSRSSGMRTLENSSSSEEEDRTDLLGRNFQVPRPKSRSNNSIANQSGIYYDVDYEPSGNGGGGGGGGADMYGSHSQSHMSTHIPGPQGIPMSTYTSGRAPSSYYMK